MGLQNDKSYSHCQSLAPKPANIFEKCEFSPKHTIEVKILIIRALDQFGGYTLLVVHKRKWRVGGKCEKVGVVKIINQQHK